MNNRKLYNLLAFVLAAIMLLGMLAGCSVEKQKTPRGSASVVSVMESKDMETADVTDTFGDGFETVIAAENSDLHVEFYEMSDEDSAKEFQQLILQNQQSGQTVKTSTSVDGNNYSVLRFSVDEQFFIVTYVENTVLIVTCDNSSKDEAKAFASELGYY